MSSAVSPTDGGNAQVKEESPELEAKHTLRIKTSAESDGDLKTVYVPLFGPFHGECSPTQSITRRKMDARALSAYSVRYEGADSALSVYDYPAVRKAIWRQVKQLLPDNQLSHLVSVAFEEGLLQSDGKRRQTIDLVFDDFKALKKVLKTIGDIEIEGRHDVQHRFYRRAFTDEMPGSVLLVDCHNLPVDDLDVVALANALKAAFQPAGSLLGFGKLATTSKSWDVQRQATEATRLYLRLHEENMSIPWLDLVHLLPTHLKINGIVHSLHYCGRHLHTEDVIPPNFTVARIDETKAPAAKKGRATPSDDSSSTAAKKRRSNK